MSTSIASTRSIGLRLGQTDLYPPLLGTAPAVVGFATALPAGEEIHFSLVVNGTPGVPEQVDLRPGSSAGGTLWVNPGFIASHAGNWPVQMTLQASRHGMVVDEATLWLHDTRQMQVHRVVADLVPNPANVSEQDTVIVMARATFYDRAGLELPRDEVEWAVTLPAAPPGLEVEGTLVRVAPGTASGDVSVRISEPSGVAQTLVLTLLPALDIGLELSKYDLYPPSRDPLPAVVIFTTTLPPDADPAYSYRLNGESGQHPGLFMQTVGDSWALVFHPDFIANYHGQWPADITVQAVLDGQLAGQRSLTLHDTRSMVCTRADIDFSPSDSVDVPDAGELLVIAAPHFYDSQDIPLPHVELEWDAGLENEPIAGIRRTRHVLFISPEAAPATHRITLSVLSGISVSRYLTLN